MLCSIGHAVMANRPGLIGQGDLTQTDGHAERRAALDMIHRHSPGSTRRLTLGVVKGFDAAGFVADLRQACVTPHIARNSRYPARDGRTARHKGYALSQKQRKRIEEAFGWAKTVAGMAQTICRGLERMRSRFIMTMAANILARLPPAADRATRKRTSGALVVRAASHDPQGRQVRTTGNRSAQATISAACQGRSGT